MIQQRALQVRTGLGLSAEGVPLDFKTMPLQDRFFRPGERTRDKGSLGDNSMVTTMSVADLHAQASRLAGTTLTPYKAHVEIEAPGNVGFVEVATVTIDGGSGQILRFLGFNGGTFRVRFRPAGIGANGQTFSMLLGVPYCLKVHVARDALLADLPQDWPAAHRESVLDAVLAEGLRVAGHALRALNVRLLIGEDSYPPHMSAPPTPNVSPAANVSDFVDVPVHPGRTVPGFMLPSVVLAGSPLTWFDPANAAPSGFNGVDLITGPGADAQKNGIIRSVAQSALDETGLDGWGTDSRFGAASMIVNVSLGVRPSGFGASAPVNEVLQRALAWFPPDTLSNRFAQLAGRSLGIQLARACCRSLMLDFWQIVLETDEPEEAADASHDDLGERIPPRRTLHTELLNPVPLDPLRDMLGIHRPDGRAIADLESDLRGQANRQDRLAGKAEHERRAGWIETVKGWTDLCSLHEWFYDRPLYGNDARTTAFDVLAGLVGDESLDVAWGTAPLPLPYEGLAFREGDRDAAGNTAARYKNAPARGATDLVTLLQEDCRRLGFTWGHPKPGHYGYIRFRSSGSAHWDGVRDTQRRDVLSSAKGDLIDGHTALAIREIQVCMDYPFGAFERLNHEPRLANRLYPIKGSDPKADMGRDLEGADLPPAQLAGLSLEVDGRTHPRTLWQIQRMRFGRRRSPLTLEAWSTVNASRAVEWERNAAELFCENVIGAHDMKDRSKTIFVVDRSGLHFPPQRRRRRLGKYSSGGWGGPVGASSRYSIISPTAAEMLPGIDLENSDERERIEYLMRIIGGVLQRESNGFVDGYNAWDNCVFSTPPFHPTLARESGDMPGQFASLINWFANPAEQYLERAFMVPLAVAPAERDRILERRRRARLKMRETWWRGYGRFGAFVFWSDDRIKTAGEEDQLRNTLSRVGAPADTLDEVWKPADGFICVPPFHRSDNTDPADNTLESLAAAWTTGTTEYGQMRALYQSYTQWFRTWPWVYRFVGGIRHDTDLRKANLIFMAEFARRTFRWAEDDGIDGHFDGSDWTASYLLRANVRGPDRYKKARNAVRGLTFATEEARRRAIKNADGETSFPSQDAPHADYGDDFTDTAIPDGGDLDDAFFDFSVTLLETMVPESAAPSPAFDPLIDWIRSGKEGRF